MAEIIEPMRYDFIGWQSAFSDGLRKLETEEFLKSFEGLTIEEKVDKLIGDFADFRFGGR